MNTMIDEFWAKFCIENDLKDCNYKEAFQFAVSADWLAELVVQGKKTATSSGYVFYELENESLPEAGQYFIVLNSKNEPVAVIQIVHVEVLPMNEVSEEFALAEGEGDYNYWWNAHEEFFKNALATYNLGWDPSMKIVCETFKVVYK